MRTAFHRTSGIFLAAIVFVACHGWSRATTITPIPWEQLVVGADLVGVIECEAAGGIVAEYRVVESWKGPAAGTLVRIRDGVNYWGDQFPIALCGERYLVTAFRKSAPSNIASMASGGPVPLWWRNLAAEYSVPLYQGLRRLDPGEEKGAVFVKLRAETQKLLAMPAEEQEAVLLRAAVRENLLAGAWLGGESDPAKLSALRTRFGQIQSVDGLVTELIDLVTADPDRWRVRVGMVFEDAGGRVALKRLTSIPRQDSPWNGGDGMGYRDLDGIAAKIRGRLERPKADAPVAHAQESAAKRGTSAVDEQESTGDRVRNLRAAPVPWAWVVPVAIACLLGASIALGRRRPLLGRWLRTAGLIGYTGCVTWAGIQLFRFVKSEDKPLQDFWPNQVVCIALALSAIGFVTALLWRRGRSVVALVGVLACALGMAAMLWFEEVGNQDQVADGLSDEVIAKEFNKLCSQNPRAVADYLVRWQKSKDRQREPDGYVLGSYFGWRCPSTRAKLLKKLLRAKDPLIRVAGAVYLSFENEADGVNALKKLVDLDGDAGAWAALTLARRGHKDAIPRLLAAFRDPSSKREVRETGMLPTDHTNLQNNILVLLSNSAHRSGVPQPPVVRPADETFDTLSETAFDDLSRWWNANSDAITLSDPWLEELDKQKID